MMLKITTQKMIYRKKIKIARTLSSTKIKEKVSEFLMIIRSDFDSKFLTHFKLLTAKESLKHRNTKD